MSSSHFLSMNHQGLGQWEQFSKSYQAPEQPRSYTDFKNRPKLKKKKNRPQLEIQLQTKISRQKLYKNSFKTETSRERLMRLDWLKQRIGVGEQWDLKLQVARNHNKEGPQLPTGSNNSSLTLTLEKMRRAEANQGRSQETK